MKLSETNNVHTVNVSVGDAVEGRELNLTWKMHQITLDQQTAAELLPILQHFIETGGLPE